MIETIHPNEYVALATGDRLWDDFETVERVISKFSMNTVFVHGYADGLDCMVEVVAKELGYRTIKCPAHWNHHYRRWIEVHGPCAADCKDVCGRPAGVLRNKWMLDVYNPDIVIAFHNNIISSKGTKDMLKRARKCGKENWLYTSNGIKITNPDLDKTKPKRKKVELESFFDW